MFLALMFAVAQALTPSDVPNPQADHNGWVTDMAGVLDATAEAEIEARLEDLHRDLDVEVAVVTVQDVDGTPKAFATGLFNLWGIGDREANNGVLVLLVLGQRRLEMETGYGLEGVLPDGWLGRMQQEHMVPAFKEGDYAAGLQIGLVHIDERLRQSPEEARDGTRGAIPVHVGGASLDGRIVLFGAAGTGGAGLLLVGGAVFRRRQRTCPHCRIYMPMVSEVDDDEHLDAVEQLEERIGSMDYQVHICPECDYIRTFEVSRWFSGYSGCPSCSARTRTTQSVVEVSPTEYSTGRRRVTEDCVNCSYHRSYTQTIAKVSPPSSSSSSGGGGSFGGGSSGGGGAGSSW